MLSVRTKRIFGFPLRNDCCHVAKVGEDSAASAMEANLRALQVNGERNGG